MFQALGTTPESMSQEDSEPLSEKEALIQGGQCPQRRTQASIFCPNSTSLSIIKAGCLAKPNF